MKRTSIQITLLDTMEIEYTIKALTTAMNRQRWLSRNSNHSHDTEAYMYEDIINRIKEARENAMD